MIRVLLADDQVLFREALHTLLSVQPGIEVVGEASNGLEAIDLAKSEKPEVVIMDVEMPAIDGIAATKQIIEQTRLAKLHGRAELDITPELYDLWLDRLVQAVREFDPMFDPEIETAWRRVLEPGIEFMKSRY